MLAEAISHAYGLAVISITPMEGGYTARCFDVRSSAGRFVAKVWRADPPGEAWVRLCELLHFLGVPATLRTLQGEPILAGPLGPMCLQPFVSGATPPGWPCWPPRVLRSLGGFLAAVHATPPPPGLPRDDLTIKASNVDGEFSAVVNDQMARLQRLRDAIDPADLSPGSMVLCHTDPGGDNILATDDSVAGVVLLDWDEAAISFPESDFVLIARDQPSSGEPLRHVLQGYGHDLQLDRLAFLMLRRYLADALARIDRPDGREGIIEWGVRQWDRLDEALRSAARSGRLYQRDAKRL